jgi:ribonuclease M5
MLSHFGLIGGKDAAFRREKIGKILGIGYANGKQLTRRLNRYGVTPEQFKNAMEELSGRVYAS